MQKLQSSVPVMKAHGYAEVFKMKLDERQIVETHVPEAVKTASRNFQMHKLMERMTGLDDFSSFDKIAAYLGGRIIARNTKWRPVSDGLMALHTLQR